MLIFDMLKDFGAPMDKNSLDSIKRACRNKLDSTRIKFMVKLLTSKDHCLLQLVSIWKQQSLKTIWKLTITHTKGIIKDLMDMKCQVKARKVDWELITRVWAILISTSIKKFSSKKLFKKSIYHHKKYKIIEKSILKSNIKCQRWEVI